MDDVPALSKIPLRGLPQKTFIANKMECRSNERGAILSNELTFCEAQPDLKPSGSIGGGARQPPRGEEHCGGFEAFAAREFANA
jgi:hypothetical protein